MACLIRRSNGVYYLVTSFHGRRIWKSTGARKKAEALKFLAESARRQSSTTELSLSQFTTQFLSHARTNLASKTVLLYEQAIACFKRLVGDFNLRAYTSTDVETFKTLRLKEVSPVKVNIDFRTLKALFQSAVRSKLIDENPFTGVKQIKVPPARPTYLTREEFSRLVVNIPIPWFRDLVKFAVCTMMRAGEIVSLTWESVDLNRRIILAENKREFRLKTTRPRVIPMNDWVFRFLSTRGTKTGPVFSFPDGKKLSVAYVSHKFKEFVRRAGFPESIHFHSLRHTGATWLVQEGVSIYEVQKLLGHSSISVTQVYSHLEGSELHNAVNKISASLS